MIRAASFLLGVFLVLSPALAARDQPEAAMSASELAARLSATQEGPALVRVAMKIGDPAGAAPGVLQLQIKQRRSGAGADVLYQILWPRERKGEAVLLRQRSGKPPDGWSCLPSQKPQPLAAAQLDEPLFGSALSRRDALENFFAWPNQTLAGSGTIGKISCVILESKPGGQVESPYARVRSWIDERRLVPMRVEKYLSSGKLARRIDTIRVSNDDRGRPLPADLSVRSGPGESVTELTGSRITHGINFSDQDFSPERMTSVTGRP